MSRDVFISYKSEEYNDAIWLAEQLSREGISTWVAPRDIPGGSSYAKEITAAIKACKAFVLILSPSAQQSQWIPKEIDNAINENKLILPFMVKKCELNDEFKFFLSNIQFKEAYIDRQKALSELISEIKAQIAKLTPPEPEKQSIPPKNDQPEPVQPKPDTSQQPFLVRPPKRHQAANTQQTSYTNPAPSPVTPPPIRTIDTTEKKNPSREEAKKRKEAKKVAKIEKKMKKQYEFNKLPKKKRFALKAKKFFLGTTIAFVALIAIIIINSVATQIHNANNIEIADTVYDHKDIYVLVENAELDDFDFDILKRFDTLYAVGFINCTFKNRKIEFPEIDSLSSLDFTGCKLTDKQFSEIDFSKLPNLKNLYVGGNEISEIKNPELLKENLLELDISETNIRDIEFLRGFKNLTVLRLNSLELTSLAPLEECIRLEEIQAQNNKLTDLTGLENTTILKKVALGGNEISDISILSKSAATVEELLLSSNNICDLSLLTDFIGLKKLSAADNGITSISPLSKCTALSYINISKNNITSLAELKSQPLYYVNASDNNIEGELAVNFVTDKECFLFASGNSITTVNITADTIYGEIDLSGNPLESASGISGFKSIKKLTLDYNDSFDYSEICTASTKLLLNNCPLDKQLKIETLLGERVSFESTKE